ncbi:hypothetical protein Alches_04360 [Alicyclobacillus hesperidum subsp. aegles]|uniref:Uncharacterized protein n=1 Tax=Alicyclobacillus hesperidum TaxID=89784 RepID=A0A1H2QWP8_9BACL|nr:hypothetical protein [Alicyclobacillus hesperidum]KRW92990.1 hypothetical protein SD51_01660 [Alicyclobacillus tengchongensis]GLG00397.1 hypothetical protein Alches_04360 [Alicyclobacillus hesperidum subsp. aegles]GLV13268.1 hypothetical protein Heshes_09520 [Alicyclobacillus hesperidum]SDW11622.1 hypothetical protein SAMN04489725_10279 [Alicyclobacillus hesperidum]
METEEQRGYLDAIRHVERALEHRKHHLQEQSPESLPGGEEERQARLDEIAHIKQVIRSLHR